MEEAVLRVLRVITRRKPFPQTPNCESPTWPSNQGSKGYRPSSAQGARGREAA